MGLEGLGSSRAEEHLGGLQDVEKELLSGLERVLQCLLRFVV